MQMMQVEQLKERRVSGISTARKTRATCLWRNAEEEGICAICNKAKSAPCTLVASREGICSIFRVSLWPVEQAHFSTHRIVHVLTLP